MRLARPTASLFSRVRLELRGVSTIEDRVRLMAEQVRKSLHDPAMRKLGLGVTRECPARADLCELERVFRYVHGHIRYTGDISMWDTYQTAARTLEFAGGDCLLRPWGHAGLGARSKRPRRRPRDLERDVDHGERLSGGVPGDESQRQGVGAHLRAGGDPEAGAVAFSSDGHDDPGDDGGAAGAVAAEHPAVARLLGGLAVGGAR